jgi:hypothetical protein
MLLEERPSRQIQHCGEIYIVLSREESVETKLQRIATSVSKNKRCQLTSQFHLMNQELLLGCFLQLRGKSASGIRLHGCRR